MSSRARVTVAVVSHDSAPWLPACLESLEAARPPGGLALDLVLVDNASTDASVELVARRFPRVRILANPTNRGYASAVNRAVRESRAPFVLILNPDVIVHRDAVAILHDTMERDTRVGLAAPRLLNPDGSLQHSCRRHYTAMTYVLRRLPGARAVARRGPGRRHLERHLMEDWDHARIRDVDWVLGAAMLLRREALGPQPLDERFFLYFEDVDLCLRLQKSGWRVVYHPDAVMTHHHQRLSGTGLVNRHRLEHFKSWLRFGWKHAAWRSSR